MPATASKLSTCVLAQLIWRCAVLRSACARGAMTYPNGTYSGASNEAGKTSKKPTNPWRNPGLCTTIQGRRRSCLKGRNEGS